MSSRCSSDNRIVGNGIKAARKSEKRVLARASEEKGTTLVDKSLRRVP